MRGVTQNIYDEDGFFAGYSQLPRSRRGLEGAPEWDSLRAMLPEEIAGRRVLDLGCGFGWFCRWAQDRGALSVTGIDVSKKMLARAQQESDPAIRYIEADLDSLALARGSADLIYSSLAFHYLTNLDGLLGHVAGALSPGGQLVFSVEHPMVTAPLHPGWSEDREGTKAWPVNHYLEDGPRTTDWLAPRVIKQHRSMTTYLNMLLHHGLTLTHLEEWGPTEVQSAAEPSLMDERHRPTFLLVSALRR
jgi:SAM-dependent methyltransferase